jgi:signal transduction histidine kinase/methanogenic corrinoid protein MtbC1
MASSLARELSGGNAVIAMSPGEVFPGAHFEEWSETLIDMALGSSETFPLQIQGLAYGRKWELDDSLTVWRVEVRRLDADHWVIFALDLTGQYRYSILLEEALEGKSRAFEMIGGVVHELRQPVSSIQGFGAIALEQNDNEELTEFLTLIVDQATELDRLIEDLLTVGLTSSGRLQVESSGVSGTELTLALAKLTQSFPDAGVTIKGSLSPSVVVADTRRLLQVVRGLLQNAVKYGGPDIRVHLHEQGDHAMIDVTDTGPGLDPGEVERVFQPFSTGTAGASIASTGIGLAIGRSLVSDMGGVLEYVATGSGANFRVTLLKSGGSSGHKPVDFERERVELIDELLAYRTEAARHRVNRLSFDQPPKRVLEEIVQPVVYEVGDRWQRGEISVAQEHHASSVVHSWLMMLLARYQPNRDDTVICASAPGNEHETGLVSLALVLAEAGYRVVYIGRGVPVDSLVETVEKTGAEALFLSLSTARDLNGLREVGAALSRHVRKGLLLVFGGRLFADGFDRVEGLPGTCLGSRPENALAALDSHHLAA